MSPQRIKELIDATPFEPFRVYTGDGSTVEVLSREFAWLRPGNRTLVVAVPKVRNATEDFEFEDHNIDVFLITKVATPIRRKGRNGRRHR
jgi:hypothetical protein